MSAETKGKKRKSGDNVEPLAKKAKTTPATAKKSADRPHQTAALLAGFSSDESEGEDDIDRDQDGIPIESLPALPKTEKAIARELKISRIKPKNINGASSDPEATPGVVYISRLPHGFYEKQLRAYLTQFGDVTNLRLARNKKTGKSQHHAFVEFAAAAVADIVVKTMDKYLMFGHILQCKRVPAEQVKEGMWKGAKAVKGSGKARPRNRIEGSRLRKGTDREGWEKRITRESERRKEKAEKLKEMGYDFDTPAIKAIEGVAVKEKKNIE